jgi:hypothetical protein
MEKLPLTPKLFLNQCIIRNPASLSGGSSQKEEAERRKTNIRLEKNWKNAFK